MRIAARAPNHLGDGVMALPALHGLSQLGRLTIHAPPWGPALYAGLSADVRPRGRMDADVAVLFAPSLRAALEARRCGRRIGTPTDHRRWLLTDIVEPGGHRRGLYARLAACAGARVDGEPTYHARGVSPPLPDNHIGLNPISASGAVVQWPGFADLAARVGPVVWYGGPGEEHAVAAIADGGIQAVGLDLPTFAAALDHCAVFVSNDSGAAHFARACGTRTVVVYGSTDPARTGPAGAQAVRGPALDCAPCYRKRCRHELGCLSAPVHRVLEAIHA